MKKLLITISIGVLALVGTATNTDARPSRGHGYHAPSKTVYVSGYRHERPVYTEKIFIGYDCYGRPKFRYRTVCAPVRNYVPPCRANYGGDYHHGNHYRSGTLIRFTFRR